MSVTTVIARVMLAIVLLSLLTTGATLMTVNASRYDAEMVNLAGSLRMQSYRLAFQLAQTGQADEADILRFSQTLNAPALSSLEDRLTPARITRSYQALLEDWRQLSPQLTSQFPESYLRQMPEFVDRIDQFVSDIQAFSQHKLQLMAIFSGLGLGLILLLALFAIHYSRRQIVPPLQSLLAASRQVQSRCFSVRVSEHSQNELGTLARAFNQMAEELGQSYQALESTVAEKTHRLQEANTALKTLYDCAQLLSVNRIQARHFSQILDHLIQLEGFAVIRLVVEEDDGVRSEFEAGQPDENQRWHQHPLKQADQSLGTLWWQHTLPCPDPTLIISVGHLLSRALYTQQTQTRNDQLLLMEERATIARELHDSLAQSLSYLKIQLALLKRQNAGAPDEARAVIDDLDQGLSQAYRQLRELLNTFRLNVQPGRLGEALTDMLAPLRSQTSACIVLHNQLPSLQLNASQHIHLLQITREAVLNAIKHAQATRIAIHCWMDGHQVFVTIADDGVGFDPSHAKHAHYGLAIMQERTESLGGNLMLTSATGEGCRVQVKFVLQQTG
ncbi:nitrate/nitrite two-component system sensor histidine kinase NarQ [Photobacterium sp. 1_MG-2023]|uniref:nitrate/nitrite two-component system sensor histidine kinase NarQ n=1 Tax=Photobacterium sp. 1_MG-2023 TaxID=3062646 RepID=UPI0026E41DFA|nr:nitrate/nitrite two-component system sensor histidine kinase NarQ [Photobacterium sp. 1_MG-2023]MDO6705247.1 nitrate/nitrite two-component system sensor histidine kinase NarQ [Photobacterium sp. 1_MG-2023]